MDLLRWYFKVHVSIKYDYSQITMHYNYRIPSFIDLHARTFLTTGLNFANCN